LSEAQKRCPQCRIYGPGPLRYLGCSRVAGPLRYLCSSSRAGPLRYLCSSSRAGTLCCLGWSRGARTLCCLASRSGGPCGQLGASSLLRSGWRWGAV